MEPAPTVSGPPVDLQVSRPKDRMRHGDKGPNVMDRHVFFLYPLGCIPSITWPFPGGKWERETIGKRNQKKKRGKLEPMGCMQSPSLRLRGMDRGTCSLPLLQLSNLGSTISIPGVMLSSNPSKDR